MKYSELLETTLQIHQKIQNKWQKGIGKETKQETRPKFPSKRSICLIRLNLQKVHGKKQINIITYPKLLERLSFVSCWYWESCAWFTKQILILFWISLHFPLEIHKNLATMNNFPSLWILKNLLLHFVILINLVLAHLEI